MRKGVVMIVTLVLVMMLTLAILKSTTITQKYFNDLSNTQFFIQFNRTFLDIAEVLSQMGQEIKDAKSFEYILKIPIIITDEKSGLQGILHISPGANTLNVNQIMDDNGTINQTMYDVLYATLNKYRLNDTLFFMALILDAIDKDSEERTIDSEIAHKENARMIDGNKLNKKSFEKIIEAYAKLRFDGRVFEIPWEKIVRFYGEEIDYNYLSKNIKEILQREYGINAPYDDLLVEEDEDISLTKEQKKVFEELHVRYYVPDLNCAFEFTYNDKSISVEFTYNIQKRRIENIAAIF